MPRHDSGAATDDVRASRLRRHGLAGWPIRRKLVALVALPLTVILVAGAIFAGQTALAYRRAVEARRLSDLTNSVVNVIASVTDEYAVNSPGGRPVTITAGSAVARARAVTDTSIRQLSTQISATPASLLSQDAVVAGQQLDQLTSQVSVLRAGIQAGRAPASLTASYAAVLNLLENYLRALSANLSGFAVSQAEINGTAAQNAMVGVSVAAGTERSLLADALQEGRLSPGVNQDITELIASQDQGFTGAALVATPTQKAVLDQIRAPNPQLDQFRADTQRLLTSSRGGDPTVYAQVSQRRLDSLLGLTRQVSADLQASAAATERNNLIRVGLSVGLSLLVLIVVGVIVSRLARSIVGPLRALRVGASDAAHVNLPHAVAEIETNGPDAVEALPPVLPPGVGAGPETLDVARAVDNLGAEAVRLAASQVRLRRTLDDAFVSMSRRSQSMVEKQLAIIDELESTEEDPDQLRNLFRLDHLAARMRRYNDNLLVLAGSAMRNRTISPVRVAELFRAATSEMEQYERVRLQPVGGAAVAGAVAGELIHLLAELLDNAAMYSPPSSSIVLSAAFTSDGGLHIEVVDSGVGIPADELDRLNLRLTRSENIELQAPSRIGLFVVARLARRGGFQVNLRQRQDANGTVAQVVVAPDAVIGAPGSTGETPSLSGLAGLSAATADARMPSLTMPAVVPPIGVPAPAGAPDGLTRRRDTGTEFTGPIPPTPEPVSAPVDALDTGSTPLPRRPRPTARPSGSPAPEPIPEPPAVGPNTGDLLEQTALQAAVPPRAEIPDTTPDTGATIALRASAPDPERTGRPERIAPASLAGDLKPISNRSAPAPLTDPVAPAAWDDELPTELAARVAAAAAYRPVDPDAPLIGVASDPANPAPTPIFDSISAWFSAEPLQPAEEPDAGAPRVIDVRGLDEEEPVAAGARWSSLGDQRWLATNARAAAAPDVAGVTATGLPRRRPGANLLPSATAAAPPTPAGERTGEHSSRDAAAVRGRLGNYQRGLASARRVRPEPIKDEFGAFDPVGATLFGAGRDESTEPEPNGTEPGGDA